MGEEYDDEENPETAAPRGAMAALHKTGDQSDLFALLGSLGSQGARGGNAMNRNPIPRGRAAESVDWLTELFKFLPPTPSSIGVSSVRVPLTLVFKHSKAHTWYMSGKRAGVMESVPSGDTEEIISRYVNQATVNAASLGLEDQIDVIALYAWTQKSSDKSSGQRSRTRIEYFDEGLLRDFMKFRPTKPDGVLQLFAIPTGSKSTCVRARYVGGRVQVETRTNVNYITDTKRTLLERAATFDGDEHVSRVGNVPASSALFGAVSRQLRDMLSHVDTCLGESYSVGEATAFFRVHSDSQLYLLYMPSLVLCSQATGSAIHPETQPLSPRVAKPQLAYAGSLPKDYFRCPCCGTVVAASERAQVPFPMMLLHIEALDSADGVMDGDSAALRAIAQTLDKVSRNPQYYAALYRAAAKANPMDNTLHLLRTCGYPGGDLELDDRLENPAELICFRLLQLAVSGGTKKEPGLQLSIAHYKWVRDNKPKILRRIKCFVCTDCSLGVSNSAFDNQAKAFSQVGPGGAVEESDLKPIASAQSILERLKGSSGASGGDSQLREVEELLEPAPSLVDNAMRKTMSLPLLKPKLDRTKAAASRPWRHRGEELVSEAPRFAPIGSLKGEMPTPDPRYLPFLQAKLDETKRRQRREMLRAGVSAAPIMYMDDDDDDAGGVFMTSSASMPQMGMRPLGGKPPRRLPSMSNPGGGEISEVVRDHVDAIGGLGDDQAALDAKIGALHARMAKLEGSMGRPRKAVRRRATIAQQMAMGDKKLAKVIQEIRSAILANMPKVIELFRTFDVNGDGLVSRIEFRQVLPILDLPKYGNGEMDALFEAIDSDKSGFIELAELNKLLRKGADIELASSLQVGAKGAIAVTAANKHALRTEAHEGELRGPAREATVAAMRMMLHENAQRAIDMFRALDKNGDGTVSKSEFRAALPLLGFDAAKMDLIDDLYNELDDNGNGLLDHSELEKALRRDDIVLADNLQAGAVAFDVDVQQRFDVRKSARDGTLVAPLITDYKVDDLKQALINSASRVLDMFRAFDADNNGQVSKSELRAALPLLGFDASNTAIIDGLFDSIDVDKSGTIEYAELGAKLRGRDDIVLDEELREGAVKFDREAKNKHELRRVERPELA